MAAKIVLVLALAACTMADPGYFGYGYGYPRAYGYGPGIAAHYGGGSSYVGRRVHGLGKRSAEPEPEAEPGYGYYGYPAYGYRAYSYGPGIAAHYGGGSSYTFRSAQGIGKRSAEAEPGYGYYGYPAYGYGGYGYAYGYPGARSYEYRSAQGLSGYRGKRSAESSYYGYGPSSYQSVQRPGSAYSVSTNGYAGRVYEDNFNGYNGAYGYGFTAYRGKRSAEPGYSFQEVRRPYANSAYAVSTNGYGGRVYEDNYNGAAYGYGFRSAYGYY